MAFAILSVCHSVPTLQSKFRGDADAASVSCVCMNELFQQLHQTTSDESLSPLERLNQFKELFDISVFPEPILDKTHELPGFLENVAPIESGVREMQRVGRVCAWL